MKTRFSRSRNNAPLLRTLLIVGVSVLVLIGFRFLLPSVWGSVTHFLWETGSGVVGSEDAELTALRAENERLRAEAAGSFVQMTMKTSTSVDAVVIARPPLSPYDVLVVRLPEGASVREGNRVFAHGVPLGEVAAVNGTDVRVFLYSTRGETTEGWIGAERVPVTVVGEGAGAFTTEVSREAAIVEGDSVYLPPAEIGIGVVARIGRSASSPASRVHIRPAVNLFTLTSVSIVP